MLSLIIIVLLLWAIFGRSNKQQNDTTPGSLSSHNQQWVQFIAGYLPLAKTKGERSLLRRMLKDTVDQNIVDPEFVQALDRDEQYSAQPAGTQAPMVSDARAEPDVTISASHDISVPRRQLDNTSLLLYFGAFLFVASMGLFVAFSGASGVVRTSGVLIVSLVLYFGGLWVHDQKQALKPAGLAFVGIGIATAPLVGVAAYKYIPTSTQGLVWFITSLFCLVLYAHALVKLKAPLLNYILIFTLLSLFESSVSIVNVPVYYYGWVMAALGIGLQALSMRGRVSSDFAESSNTMSSIFLPLAVCISLFMTPQHGAGQLGVSLLFAACFYGLGAVRSVGNERASNVVIAHISALAGVSSLVYALTNDSLIVGVTLLVLAVIQVGSLVTQQQNRVLYNALTTTVASALISLVFLYASPALFTLGVAVVIVSTLVPWSMCQRDDLYVIAMVGWLALPLVVGQMLLQPALDIREQAILSLVSLALHIVLFVFAVLPEKRGELTATARAMLALHILLTLSIALAGSAGFALVLVVAIGLLILPLSMLDESRFWAAFSGAVVASSVLRLWTDALLSLALFVSLGYSILLALRFRDEANRWMSTGLWLLVPIGLGGATVQTTWPPEYFAWAYVVAMIGLIISRMIARGRVFVSGNIPLSSYAESASVSYVAGYVTAGFLAVAISLAAGNSQLHTSLILIVLSMLCVAISRFVEQKSSILAALPFLGQGILFSVARPTASSDAMVVTLLFSTAIAVGAYLLFNNLEDVRNTERHPGVYAAIMTTCINPAFIVVLPATIWVMPVGLSVLGLVLLDYTRKETQDSREVSVGLIVAGVLWLLGYLGIREVQAYTHIIAAMFAGFAYWRHRRGERQQSNTYLYWMLGTATVPLIFQSMGQAGDIYGWWLLLEQVAFMLLGMAIQRRFVTMWALYVAIGAVLYQLRDLGYAALAVLATFVIGIAVYQLQKHDKK